MNWILIGIALTTLIILGSSRIAARVKAVAFQGFLLSIMQFVMRGSTFDMHGAFLMLITIAVKTIAIPLLIFKMIKEVSQRPSKKPFIENHLILLFAGLITVLSFFNIKFFPLTKDPLMPPLLIPVALMVVLTGFLILVTKTKATNQIIGFLLLENGIFTFGMTIISEFPTMVEIGVLLDLLVGVFVMGVMIYHINKTFDNIDTRTLSALGDS